MASDDEPPKRPFGVQTDVSVESSRISGFLAAPGAWAGFLPAERGSCLQTTVPKGLRTLRCPDEVSDPDDEENLMVLAALVTLVTFVGVAIWTLVSEEKTVPFFVLAMTFGFLIGLVREAISTGPRKRVRPRKHRYARRLIRRIS